MDSTGTVDRYTYNTYINTYIDLTFMSF